jgi:Tfp pilus assembly protein PilF
MSRRRHDKSSKERATRPVEVGLDAVDAMLLRARKMRQKGDARRALVTLRQAVNVDEKRPRAWALLGAMSRELGLDVDAARAFEQARWLNARAGFTRRAAVCERLAARAMPDAA